MKGGLSKAAIPKFGIYPPPPRNTRHGIIFSLLPSLLSEFLLVFALHNLPAALTEEGEEEGSLLLLDSSASFREREIASLVFLYKNSSDILHYLPLFRLRST